MLGTSSFGATQVGELAQPAAMRVSGDPGGIAIDAQRLRAYVVDTAQNTLMVFDLNNTGQPIAYASTGTRPFQVVLGQGRAYVSNFADRSISVVDLVSNTTTATVAAGGPGLALDSSAGRLYVAESGRIAVLDASSYKLVRTIEVPAGANVWGLALDAAGSRLYATDIASPRVLAFDTATGQLVRELALTAPARFAIAFAGGRLAVATYTASDPQLVVFDTTTGSVAARRPSASFTNALVIDVAGTVFSTSTSEKTVRSADTRLSATLADATIADGVGGIALDPVTSKPIVVTRGGAAPPARTLPESAPVVRP